MLRNLVSLGFGAFLTGCVNASLIQTTAYGPVPLTCGDGHPLDALSCTASVPPPPCEFPEQPVIQLPTSLSPQLAPPATAVVLGSAHGCILTASQDVWCWVMVPENLRRLVPENLRLLLERSARDVVDDFDDDGRYGDGAWD